MPERPHGTWGTVLIPWDDDDRIDERRLHRQLDVLTTAGLSGVYAHGTAGEFHELDDDEWDHINEIVVARCRDAGVPVQLGAGHMSFRVCTRRIAHAAAHRPDAIQVTLPDWLPVTTGEAIIAVEWMAETATGIPLVLYNPPHAKTVLGPPALAELSAAVPSLVAIKVGAGGPDWYAAMAPVMQRLAVFVPGHMFATGRALGAAGSFSNVACLSPGGAVAWDAMMDSDPLRAADVERRIRGFLDTHIMPWMLEGYPNPALDKALAHIGGWADIGTRIRGPWRSVPTSAAERLRPAVRRELPELFDDV
jgi:dihydrodipicolinate synthase/N-acetylneuraminate lyase